jgi:hypothetical protein
MKHRTLAPTLKRKRTATSASYTACNAKRGHQILQLQRPVIATSIVSSDRFTCIT